MYLGNRVSEMLDNIQDPDKADLVFPLLNDGLAECGDRLSYVFDEINLAMKTADLVKDDTLLSGKKLAELGMSFLKLETIRGLALAKARKEGLGDEIEVVLAYQVELKDTLDLPVTNQAMLFPGASQVTADDLSQAHDVCAALGQTDLAEYLQTWSPWQTWLTGHFEEDFERSIAKLGNTPQSAATARLNFYKETTAKALLGFSKRYPLEG